MPLGLVLDGDNLMINKLEKNARGLTFKFQCRKQFFSQSINRETNIGTDIKITYQLVYS